MNPQKFIASLSFDIRLAPYDIMGSLAHARMLANCKNGISSYELSKTLGNSSELGMVHAASDSRSHEG